MEFDHLPGRRRAMTRKTILITAGVAILLIAYAAMVVSWLHFHSKPRDFVLKSGETVLMTRKEFEEQFAAFKKGSTFPADRLPELRYTEYEQGDGYHHFALQSASSSRWRHSPDLFARFRVDEEGTVVGVNFWDG